MIINRHMYFNRDNQMVISKKKKNLDTWRSSHGLYPCGECAYDLHSDCQNCTAHGRLCPVAYPNLWKPSCEGLPTRPDRFFFFYKKNENCFFIGVGGGGKIIRRGCVSFFFHYT